MLNIPVEKRHPAPLAGLGLLPAFLLAVGLVTIGVTVGFIFARRSPPARAFGAHADVGGLLRNVAATRDAQQVELVQLGNELETVRQTLATITADRLLFARQGSGAKSPLALILDVPLLKQEHSLSCESSAAAMAARFYGLPIEESDVLGALPLHENPHLGFRGNVDGAYGGIDDYGVYAEPIRQALATLGLEATHLSGGIDEIREHILMGRPVIAWVTYRMQAQTPRQVTVRSDSGSRGTRVTLVPYEHTVLVVGYNADGLWVHDPYDGSRTWYGEDDFRRSFAYLGNMALVVGPPTTYP